MFCPHCGSPADSKFCPTCGKEVAASSQVASSTNVSAGFWRRALATIVDEIIVTLPLTILLGVTASGGSRYFDLLIVFAIQGLYQVRLMARPSGQTYGASVAKIRVVNIATGQPASTGQLWRRYSMQILFGLMGSALLIGIIDPLWCIWDKQGQTLHDKIAGTNAIKVQ